MIQFVMTPAGGKRLIALSLVNRPDIQAALQSGTLVIIAGTTNACVAEEILGSIGVDPEAFRRNRFFRGITLPPYRETTDTGRLSDETEFPGDLVIENGVWKKGKTIFDVVDNLKEGDVILKGANALDLERRQAGVLIGHPKGGTISAALQAVVGRRVRLILPVGLEKRVSGDIHAIANLLNDPGAQGLRLLPVPGEIVTELDAWRQLTGAQAELIAAGGVCGAEGAVWIAISGTEEQEKTARMMLKRIRKERPFSF